MFVVKSVVLKKWSCLWIYQFWQAITNILSIFFIGTNFSKAQYKMIEMSNATKQQMNKKAT